MDSMPLTAPSALESLDHWSCLPSDLIILVFASNTEVLNVEDLLEEAELPFELLPVPKEVNPNCGLAIGFKEADRKEIMAVLTLYKPLATYVRRGDKFSSFEPVASQGEPQSVGKAFTLSSSFVGPVLHGPNLEEQELFSASKNKVCKAKPEVIWQNASFNSESKPGFREGGR